MKANDVHHLRPLSLMVAVLLSPVHQQHLPFVGVMLSPTAVSYLRDSRCNNLFWHSPGPSTMTPDPSPLGLQQAMVSVRLIVLGRPMATIVLHVSK